MENISLRIPGIGRDAWEFGGSAGRVVFFFLNFNIDYFDISYTLRNQNK